jgi:hypothetical protein
MGCWVFRLLARVAVARNISAMPPYSLARRVVSWVVIGAGGTAVVASMIEAFTADPQQGEGWIGGPIQAVFMGGPLIAIGFALRSSHRSVARRTAIASLLLALVVGFVLTMQLIDANETTSDRLVQCAGMVVYLTAFIVEIPAFTSRWESRDAPSPV